MTAGLALILAVLAVAVLVALLLRRRAIIARRPKPGVFAFLTDQGWTVGTSPHIPPGTGYVGRVPAMSLEPGHLFVHALERDGFDAEMLRLRMEQSYALRVQQAPRPGAAVIITGV